MIPLFARKICSERYPSLFSDLEAERICSMLDYDFASREKKMRGTVGVFYYFETEDARRLFSRLAHRFPGGVLAFDSCNRRGAKMMTKTWLKEAGIRDVDALFSLEDPASVKDWSEDFASVTSKSYMRGYRDISGELGFIHRQMLKFCDNAVNMWIIKISFREG